MVRVVGGGGKANLKKEISSCIQHVQLRTSRTRKSSVIRPKKVTKGEKTRGNLKRAGGRNENHHDRQVKESPN